MNMTVLSYSLTGNNDALAKSAAQALSAKHVPVTEPKTRTTGTIIGDMLFGKTPKTTPSPDCLDGCGFVLLLGPVWMGSVAAPLRTYLKYLKKSGQPYAFASISGGALGPNPKLSAELQKRTGRAPAAVIDLHIADLLPSDPPPTRDDTSNYKVTNADVTKLTEMIVSAVKDVF